MSNLFKTLSLMSLTALLFLVAVAGRAQDNDAKKAPALGNLPAEKERDLEDRTSREDALTGENADVGIERGPVPPAAIEPPSSSLLPVVPPVSRYEEIWKNSPFELEAAPDVVSTAKESFAKDYALSGMLKEGDKTIVYIINRKTKETHKVTSEGGGEGGFKLQSLEGASNSVRDVEATIEKDGEVARLTYDKALMVASAGAAMKNHPSSQQNLDNAQNPRQGANNPQDRSAAATAARARQIELAARSGRLAAANGDMGSRASGGTSTRNPANSRPDPSPPSSTRRRIVLPKRPVPPEQM